MRIGFDSKRVFSNFRGLGSYSRNLVRNLCTRFPNSDYYLYTPQLDAKILDESFPDCKDLKIRLPSISRPKILAQAWRSFGLNQAIRKDKLDIYHGLSHQLPVGNRYGKTRWLVTIHDLLFLRYPQFFSPADRWIYAKKIRHSTTVADSVIAISQQTKEDLISYMSVPEEKITVLYQCSDPLFGSLVSDKEKSAIRAKYYLPQEYILYVGALLPHKNAMSILKAMHRLKAQIDLYLVVVGKGDAYQKKMIQFAHQAGLAKRLIFLNDRGYVDNQELRVVYQMASLFIYPSLFEGFGLPVLEALLSKVPVIAGCGLEEAGGPHSLYFQTDDEGEALAHKIRQIVNDQNLRDRMINGGMIHARKFDSVHTSEALMSHYRGLIG